MKKHNKIKNYPACIQSRDRKADGQNEDGDRLNEAESSVDSQVKVTVLRFRGVAEGAVGPEVEPVVGADGGALVDQLHADAEETTKESNIL